MTANLNLKSDGYIYPVTDPISDAQLKGFTDYLDRKGWVYIPLSKTYYVTANEACVYVK